MSKVTVSAPGKLMFFGEHAVVYGHPCIVTSVNKYITVEVEKTASSHDILHTPDISNTSFVRKAIDFFRKKFRKDDAISLTTRSELGNYGLGSSAAVTVATLSALAKLYNIRLSQKGLFDLCYEVVLAVQKTASGFDVAASIYRGTILFDGKSKKVARITSEKLPLIAVYSGKKVSTTSQIDKVKQLKNKKPQYVSDLFLEISKIVMEAKLAIENRNWHMVGKLMNKNHELLVKLGVSNQILDELVMKLSQAGALGAKLSGAGGGDCVIAIATTKRKKIEREMRGIGGKILDI